VERGNKSMDDVACVSLRLSPQNSFSAKCLAQFVLVLFSEAIANREEVPTPLLVHFPHIRFLTRVFGIGFVDEMHEEEEVVGEVVFLHGVGFESVGVFVEVVGADAADEALRLHVLLHLLQLASQLAERVDDQTLDNSEENNNDEQEEGVIKDHSPVL